MDPADANSYSPFAVSLKIQSEEEAQTDLRTDLNRMECSVQRLWGEHFEMKFPLVFSDRLNSKQNPEVG